MVHPTTLHYFTIVFFAPCVTQTPPFCRLGWDIPSMQHPLLFRAMCNTNSFLLCLTGTSSNAAFVYVSPFAPWVVQTSLFWTYLVHPSKLHWLRVTTPPLTSILVHPTWLQSFLLAPCAMRDTNSTLDDNICTSHKASRLHCHHPSTQHRFFIAP